jgi:protein-glutamine gamma-glutamyltransferase
MTLVERFRVSAIFLVLLAMIAFCVAIRSPGLLILTLPLAILSWYVTEGPRGRVLPRVVQNILLVVLLLWAALEATRLPDASETMGLLGRFVQWLLLVKLFGRKTRRDYAQIISLSAVLVMAGTLQTVEFTFAIAVFAYTALALWTVLQYQLWAARERAREQRDQAIERAKGQFGPGSSATLAPPVQAVFGRSLAWQFRTVAASATGLGLLLSIVVFLIFPRELADMARRESRFGAPRVGFNEELQLFTNNRITDSQREVFSVTWSDARRGEVMRFAEPLYLRGAVLSRYIPSDGRWERPARAYNIPIASEKGTFRPLSQREIDERFQTYIQQVTMRTLAPEVVFSSWAPIAIAADENRQFEFDPGTLLLRERRGASVGRSSTYSVKVQPYANEATLEAISRTPRPIDVSGAFPVGSIVDFTRELVRRLDIDPALPDGLDLNDPRSAEPLWQRNRRVARALAEWLRSPEFEYTTDLGNFVRIVGEDPIYSFLARYRFGHCEYFASALVAMCQSLGIEARVVTGYLAIEFDEAANAYIVRESNAHAWAEVRVGAFAWLTLDPTPGETLARLQESRRSWSDRFRWLYDRVEFLWNSQVVTFDSGSQAALAERVGGTWQRLVRDWLDGARQQLRRLNNFFSFGQAGTLWLGLVGFAGILAVAAVVSVRRRRRRLRLATGIAANDAASRALLRQLGFWLDALDVLERRGHGKPASRTPRDHAAALAPAEPELAARFDELVELFYRTRFAGEDLTSERRNRAESLVAELGTVGLRGSSGLARANSSRAGRAR